MKERCKHLLNFCANLVVIIVEACSFGYIWYVFYGSPFYRRGNWAVIGLYILILFFFTHVFGGYKIGYKPTADIVLSHVLTIILSSIIAYFEICMISRDYMNPNPIVGMMCIQIFFIAPWVYIVRKIYKFLYPPRQLLVIYGNYSPVELINKINKRNDKYNICASVCYKIGDKNLMALLQLCHGVVLCDLPAEVRNNLMKYCYRNSIRTYVTPKISDILFRGAEDLHLFDTPLLLLRNQGLSIVQLFVKRLLDILFSLIGCIVFLPIMILIGISIKAYDKGPVFYKQSRLTKNGAVFVMYKFRSMCINSEKEGAQLARRDDRRITPVGRIIRNLHLDELPQLFNILKGDMSFVGPRPERPVIFKQYTNIIPEFDLRLKIKAGLTGYAQVYGKYNTTPYDKLKLDITYIENYSFWLDIKILLLTFKIILQKDNTEGIDLTQKTAIKNDKYRK